MFLNGTCTISMSKCRPGQQKREVLCDFNASEPLAVAHLKRMKLLACGPSDLFKKIFVEKSPGTMIFLKIRRAS
jgi:hypothetical protein